MRLLSTTIYGISPAYRAGPATLNVAGLPGVLTAVTGANGAGKSTLLGAGILGAIYRKIPKLGGTRTTSLASLAQGRGAYVESRFDFGGALGEMTFRQTVDAGDERPEALLLGAGRQRHRDLPTTSVKAFDAWVGERLQPYEVIASGLFLAQQNNGLVRMTEGDRKSVIIRAIGADRLERLAEAARRRATAAAEDLATTTGSLAVARERATSPAAAREALTAAERALAESHGAARVARDALQLAQRRAAMASQHDATIGRLHALDVARADARRTRDGIGDVSAAIAAARALDERIATVREEWADAARAVEYGRAACERLMRDAKAAEVRLTATRQRYQAERERLEAEHASAEATLADRERRLANNRALLADADVIYAAERRVAEIDAALSSMRDERVAAVAAADVALTRAGTQAQRRDEAKARAATASRQGSQAMARLTGAAAVRDAVASLPGAIAAQEAVAVAERAARAHVEALRESASTSWQRRIHGLRCVLWAIVRGDVSDAARAADDGIAADDVAERDAAALPEAITAALAALRVAESEHVAARAHRQQVEALAARVDEVSRDEATYVAAEGEARKALAESTAASALVLADNAERTRLLALVEHIEGNIATLQRERDGLAQRARHAPRLATAEERVAELTREVAADRAALKRTCDALEALPQALARDKAPDIAASDEANREAASAREALAAATTRRDVLADDVAALREQRAALGDPDALAAEADRATATLATLAPQIAGVEGELAAIAQDIRELGDDVLTVADATAALSHAQEQQRDAAVAEARALDAVEEADEAEGRVGRLDTARLDAARELREWTVLAAELGRDGLQADLVDSVAPELTETANDLLRASLGSRWRVRFEASKINSKGAVVEGFALRVIDTVMGREDDAADFCGGETALIGSAIADAVAVVGCKRAQLEAPTLVRDEGDAALGAENRRPWIEMLRRTAAITGASKILVVSHRDDVVALCDSVVDIADGRITVRS